MNNNDKLILNTALLRKESEFRTKSCMVEKAIAVSHAEFDDLKRHPLRDNKMIAENAELMYCDRDDNYHCLLIYDEEQGDGLLIESEGFSYARYAQYIPRATAILKQLQTGTTMLHHTNMTVIADLLKQLVLTAALKQEHMTLTENL